jgi:hypothetical protein
MVSYSIFAIADSVEAAAITAIITGCFAVMNTVINAFIIRKAKSVESKADRLLEIMGERQSDKPITAVGQNPVELVLEKDRRKE